MRWRAGVLCALLLTPSLAAQEKGDPNVVDSLRRCRAIAEATTRLSCFDTAAASINGAIRRKELVILDRQEVRRTGKSLFGLPLPNLKLLTGSNGEIAVKEVDAKIVSVHQVSYQKYDLVLDSGAVWRNIDLMVEPPRIGDVVHLSKGLAGGFFMKAPKLQPVRAARIR